MNARNQSCQIVCRSLIDRACLFTDHRMSGRPTNSCQVQINACLGMSLQIAGPRNGLCVGLFPPWKFFGCSSRNSRFEHFTRGHKMKCVRQDQHFSSNSSTWEPHLRLPKQFKVKHRQESFLFSMNKETSPIQNFVPSKVQWNCLTVSFHQSPACGCPCKFCSEAWFFFFVNLPTTGPFVSCKGETDLGPERLRPADLGRLIDWIVACLSSERSVVGINEKGPTSGTIGWRPSKGGEPNISRFLFALKPHFRSSFLSWRVFSWNCSLGSQAMDQIVRLGLARPSQHFRYWVTKFRSRGTTGFSMFCPWF